MSYMADIRIGTEPDTWKSIMITLFFIGSALLLTFLADSVVSAPLGYEDELGFHYGEPGNSRLA
jgi:hypothetical protein